MQAQDLNLNPSSRSVAYDAAGNSFEVTSERIVERPLIQFSGSQLQQSLELFESFDDQIMGGISQSTLKPGTINDASGEPNCAVFSGVVRVEGGGFVGNRMKLLAVPLDLSPFTGLYLKVRGDDKVYKLNLRTAQTSNEVVYQAQFEPPADAIATVRIPFGAFRLVRRSVPVPGAAPLPSASIYQMGLVLSKFAFGEDDFNRRFVPGTFRLEVAEIGVYTEPRQATAWIATPGDSDRAQPLPLQPAAAAAAAQGPALAEPDGRKRSWLKRFLLSPLRAVMRDRFRAAMRSRVRSRRSERAKELLALRRAGRRLSEIRRDSWAGPAGAPTK